MAITANSSVQRTMPPSLTLPFEQIVNFLLNVNFELDCTVFS